MALDRRYPWPTREIQDPQLPVPFAILRRPVGGLLVFPAAQLLTPLNVYGLVVLGALHLQQPSHVCAV